MALTAALLLVVTAALAVRVGCGDLRRRVRAVNGVVDQSFPFFPDSLVGDVWHHFLEAGYQLIFVRTVG